MQDTQYNFGPFRLYPTEHLLMRDTTPILLAPKAYELLVALVSKHGHLVTRNELMKTIWPDSYVEEINLTVNISLLRKTLGEQPDGRPYITTVPKCGYRFDANVVQNLAGGPNGVASVVLLPVAEETEEEEKQPALIAADTSIREPAPSPPVLSPPSRRTRAWLVIFLVAVVAASALLTFIYRQRHTQAGSTASRPQIRSLAILPFSSLGPDKDAEYLGLGMTDALITRLNGLHQIVVRPIEAVRGLAGNLDPLVEAKKLGVDAVLDGTVQRLGNTTRVTARLLRTSNGDVLASNSFDEQNTNVFALEDSISQKLAQDLTLHLTPAEQERLSRVRTENSQAYDLYTKGRYYWNKRSVASVQESLEMFRQAIDVDPNYVAAYSGLADAYILAGSYGNSFLAPQVAMPKAKEAAEKVLALDGASSEAHTSLAYIKLTYDWDWAGAEAEFKRALMLNPSYVIARHWYSHELAAEGRFAESHQQSEAALALDPTDVLINEHMAWHHLMAREYDRAISQALKAIELDPDFVQAHHVLGLAHLYTGRMSEACVERGAVA